MHALRLASALAAGLLLAACAASAAAPGRSAARQDERAAATRSTESFRLHHAEIREHLDHVDTMAAALAGQSPEEQRRTMQTIVDFLTEHIGPHAADEERVLYPVVERQAGAGSRLTAVMIHEHRIVERSIAALRREAAEAAPDAAAFAREALHLMGLLLAHFECEEEVLLPVLDRTMTTEQFEREVAARMPH